MDKQLELFLLLDDINEYVNSVLLYFNNTNNEFDIDEIIMYLSSVNEITKTIKKIVLERN